MKRTTPPKPKQLVAWFSETVLHTPRSSWLDLEQAPMHDPVWPYPPVSSCGTRSIGASGARATDLGLSSSDACDLVCRTLTRERGVN